MLFHGRANIWVQLIHLIRVPFSRFWAPWLSCTKYSCIKGLGCFDEPIFIFLAVVFVDIFLGMNAYSQCDKEILYEHIFLILFVYFQKTLVNDVPPLDVLYTSSSALERLPPDSLTLLHWVLHSSRNHQLVTCDKSKVIFSFPPPHYS